MTMGMFHEKGDYENLLFGQVRGVKEKDPYFQISRKEKDKADRTRIQADRIEGMFEKIEVGTEEYEGKTKPTYRIYVSDGTNTIKLKMGFTVLGRSLLNTLANAKTVGKLNLSVYAYDKGEGPRIGFSIKIDGEKVGRKYQKEDQAKLIVDTPTPDGIVRSYKLFNEALTKEIDGINMRSVMPTDAPVAKQEMTKEDTFKDAAEKIKKDKVVADDEDLPF